MKQKNNCPKKIITKTLSYFNSLKLQYIIAFAISFLFLGILLLTPTSYKNIQLPEGQYKENLWMGTDVMTYVAPAKDLLNHWKKARIYEPDFHRSIGYPFFLAIMMLLFKANWLYFTFIFQAILYSGIYPALSIIAQTIFPKNKTIVPIAFLFSLISGAYFIRTAVILTDLFFTAWFIIGLALSFKAIKVKKISHMLLAIICLGFSGQIRPCLIYFPIAFLLLLLFIAKTHNTLSSKKTITMIIIATTIMIPLGYLPSIRNYVNHKIFKQTDIVGVNLFGNAAMHTLKLANRLDKYEAMNKEISNLSKAGKGKEKLDLMEKYAFKTFREYPIQAATYIGKNHILNLMGTHWTTCARYWGYWGGGRHVDHIRLKKSNITFITTIIFGIIYLIIYSGFSMFLIELTLHKKWLFLSGLITLIGSIFTPTTFAGGGQRMRLPVEGIIVICATYFFITKLKNKKQSI